MSNFFADYLASWDSLDVDAVMAFFTDDVEYLDTTITHRANGAARMRKFVQASNDNVANARFDYVGHVSDGNGYAIEWIMQPMNIPGVSVGKLRDGKICQNRDYWNGAAFKVPNT